MGERLIYIIQEQEKGKEKPITKGTIIDVDEEVEWPLTSQESERIIDVVAEIQRPLMRFGKKAEAIESLQKIIDEVAEEARHDTRGIRELKQAGVEFGEGKPLIMGKPVDRNLI